MLIRIARCDSPETDAELRSKRQGALEKAASHLHVAKMDPSIVDAIETKRRLRFFYNGKQRRAEPQCYGVGKRGTQLLRVHQLDGGGVPEPLFDVARIQGLAVLDETFDRPGPNYRRDDSAMVTIYAQL